MGCPNGLEPNLLETSDGTMVDVVATVLCVHPGCTVAETLIGKQIFRTDAKIVTGSFKITLFQLQNKRTLGKYG